MCDARRERWLSNESARKVNEDCKVHVGPVGVVRRISNTAYRVGVAVVYGVGCHELVHDDYVFRGGLVVVDRFVDC